MIQVAGGQTDLACAGLGAAKSMADSGKVRLLVHLGDARAPAPYDIVPTMKEFGYNVSCQ
jgi:tripartite-type tricarboxylate transporter receptor subunit TctC